MTLRHAQGDTSRIVVAGHVDHGKSTLIGRLMLDLGLLHQSKIDEVIASSARRGTAPEWSYVLDSLQEERDQAITIDTTRLWFTLHDRRYTIIDAPGHRQFLANMLSGASEADAAILVVDAAAGIGDQTLRHAYLLAFLGIGHVIVAVNKIDLLDDAQRRFAELERTLRAALHRTPPAQIVPVSASRGENVVARASTTPWYTGPTIAEAIASIRRVPAPLERAFRLDVQDVYRRDGERVVVGTVASGALEAGAEVLLLPAGVLVRAEKLVRWPEGETATAWAGESVGVVLDGDRFVGRGDTLAALSVPPRTASRIALEAFWLDARGPHEGERLRLKRGTQSAAVVVDGAPSVYDIEAAHDGGPDHPAQHNLVRLAVRAGAPLVFDRRADDPHGSRMVLLRGDRVVAVGFTTDVLADRAAAGAGRITLAEREERAGHGAAVVWLTGLSGAGKSTLALAAERRLFDRGARVAVVDGDLLRETLNADLGFSDADRAESVRRAAVVAGALAATGQIVLVSLIAPFAADRAAARAASRVPFHEVYVHATLAECERRDPKGHYRRARSGALPDFTGIDSPYEVLTAPDLVIDTGSLSIEDAVDALVAFIDERTRQAVVSA
ncbi:MAG: adenylyl-sulfate kinase [Candidatus Eremiobacteraeota bacterium]|nr:adenylyl-sulfate kinase [Candidatus Eremiobacteraeota bacterium]